MEMALIDGVLAGIALAVCVVLLLRLVVGARRRDRFDAAARRTWRASRQRAVALWRWPGQRRAAARAADEIIRRAARRDADQDGNVIRPKAFHEGRGPRKPH